LYPQRFDPRPWKGGAFLLVPVGSAARRRRGPRGRPRCFSLSEQLLSRNVKRFRGGLVFKAHRRVYHSTLGLRVIKNKRRRSLKASRSTRTSKVPARGLVLFVLIVLTMLGHPRVIFREKRLGLIVWCCLAGVKIFKGLPGPECGHSVAASSYFDRLWDNGKHTRRHFLFLKKC